MTRKQLLNLIFYAGYHNDTATGTRLYVENRISFSAYGEMFQKGRSAYAAGKRCGCLECSKKEKTDDNN